MKARKKPVEIDFIVWNGENLFDVIAFTDGKPELNSDIAMERWEQYENLVKREGLLIYSLESGPKHQAKHFASIGDYIVKGVKGEHYPVKPDIFPLLYDILPD